MGQMYCKNITSVKRHLPEGSNLLLGDQILGGSAIKEGAGESPSQTNEELLKNDIAAKVFGVNTGTVDQANIGTELVAGDFVTEGGFVAGPDGVDVVHSGYGGEARVFAPGTGLKEGDIVLNGTVVNPNGQILDAPFGVDGEGYTTGNDGAIVSPGGTDDDEAYCSLQELAGKSDEEGDPLDDLDLDLDLDLDIPGLDFAWWVKIQQKVNELMLMAGKFLAKTQNLVALVELNPEDACKYIPDVTKLIKIMEKALRIIRAIEKIMRAVEKIISTLEKAMKILEWVFAPLKIVKAWLMILQVIKGIPKLIIQAARTLTDTSKLIPQLIALLNKVLAQCAANRGADAGLSKEECEALGGVYVDRRIGDLGDASGGGLDDGFGTTGDGDPEEELDFGFMPPGTGLNSGDNITDGTAYDGDGNIHTAPFIVDGDGWSTGDDGATGISDNVKVSNERLEANIDKQILDLSQCMIELEDFEKTANWR